MRAVSPTKNDGKVLAAVEDAGIEAAAIHEGVEVKIKRVENKPGPEEVE